MRIDGPSLAERSRVGCKELRSAEYRAYSSERRRKRVGGVELGSAMPAREAWNPSRVPTQQTTWLRPPGDAEAMRNRLLASGFERAEVGRRAFAHTADTG